MSDVQYTTRVLSKRVLVFRNGRFYGVIQYSKLRVGWMIYKRDDPEQINEVFLDWTAALRHLQENLQ